jgi:hypothetical protein
MILNSIGDRNFPQSDAMVLHSIDEQSDAMVLHSIGDRNFLPSDNTV